MRLNLTRLQKIAVTGLFAALIYVGVFSLRFPLPAIVGRPFIHFGNLLTALAVLMLGFRAGAVAGVIGLGGFDLLNGYAATSWLTMIEAIIFAAVLTLVDRMTRGNDVVVGICGGITKIITSYLVGVVESLMIGTALSTAMTAALFSLTAAVANAIFLAILLPICCWGLKRLRHHGRF